MLHANIFQNKNRLLKISDNSIKEVVFFSSKLHEPNKNFSYLNSTMNLHSQTL